MAMHSSRHPRPSQSGPAHRCPSWAVKDADYLRWIAKSSVKKGVPGSDFGLDTFAYDPQHLEQWVVSAGIVKQIPQELERIAEDWVCAGAAVCTSLDRIAKMRDEAFDRAYPGKSYGHLRIDTDVGPPASSTNGYATLSGVGGETPPSRIPTSAIDNTVPDFTLAIHANKPGHTSSMMAQPSFMMETPPMTPPTIIDPASTETGYTGQKGANLNAVTNASALELAAKLSTLPKLHKAPTPPDLDLEAYYPRAHELYLSAFEEEYTDLTRTVVPRLKGYARLVERHLAERKFGRKFKVGAGSSNNEEDEAIGEFVKWFQNQVGEMKKLEQKVEMVEWPDIGE